MSAEWGGRMVHANRNRSSPAEAAAPVTVAISGASGLVGSAVAGSLEQAGHSVRRLVRGPTAPGGPEISWDPARGTIDAARLEGLDAVVHMAGENIAAGRWTKERKARIRSSRVDGTRLIATSLAGVERPPRVLISASAIGYYGDRGDEDLDEDSPPGTGFLAETCREWEAATEPAAEAGLRVVQLRIGVVLASRGGALARMVPLFRKGLGGRLGSGRQFMSWVALEDLTSIVLHALSEETLRGPVNAVAPAPVRNAEFTRVLANVLGRPAVLPAPAPALSLLLGEMGRELLLAGARIRPRRLEEAGFGFRFPDLESALRFELRRGAESGPPEASS